DEMAALERAMYYHFQTLGEGGKFRNFHGSVRRRLRNYFRHGLRAEFESQLTTYPNHFVVAIICLHDLLDEMMAHNIPLIEVNEGNAFHTLQNVDRVE